MSLEDKIQELIVALEANTKALQAKKQSPIVEVKNETKIEAGRPESKPEVGAVSSDTKTMAPEVAPGATAEDVANAVKKLVGERSRDDAIALLAKFGVKKASEITEDQRQAFVDEANAILAG